MACRSVEDPSALKVRKAQTSDTSSRSFDPLNETAPFAALPILTRPDAREASRRWRAFLTSAIRSMRDWLERRMVLQGIIYLQECRLFTKHLRLDGCGFPILQGGCGGLDT